MKVTPINDKADNPVVLRENIEWDKLRSAAVLYIKEEPEGISASVDMSNMKLSDICFLLCMFQEYVSACLREE